MNRHFDIEILYKEKSLGVTVQCLSDELPLIYAVWPKDESLKHAFDNSYVLFSQQIKRKGKDLTTWHKVHYSKEVKLPDLDFEQAIWEELSKFENVENF